MNLRLIKQGRGNKLHAVEFGSLIVWFSYETPIAFCGNTGIVCRRNEWGNTTGRHLNSIQPNHKKRVDGSNFLKMLENEFSAKR
jgi:hypothetical protein